MDKISSIKNKFNSASPAVKASMVFFASNMILKGLSFFSGAVFTRLMTSEQYGIVSTFQSWLSLFACVITLNLHQGVFNNGMLDYKDDRDGFLFSLSCISALSTALFGILFFVFRRPLLQFLEIPKELIYIMFLYYLFQPPFLFWSGRQRYEYKYKALSIISIVIAFLSLGLGIIFVLLTPSDRTSIARVAAMEGVSIAFGLFFSVELAIRAKWRCRFEHIKYALKFNVPLIPHYLSMYVLASSDRIMLKKMVDASATAIYSVAYTVAALITIVWTSIEASLSPWIYEKLNDKDEEAVKRITLQIIAVFAAMCIVCSMFAPEIMMILGPEEYQQGIYVIPPVSVGVFFTAMYSLYMRIELFNKQTKFATLASTMAALANIILNYIFIQLYGFVAAGYTTLACYALLALFHYFNVKRRGYEKALNNKAFAGMAVLVIAAMLLTSWLYSYIVARYCVIVIVLIIAFVKRKELIAVIKIKR